MKFGKNPVNNINYFFLSQNIRKLRYYYFNSIPKNNFLDWIKFKAFADKLDIAKLMISILDRIEHVVGKGENAGYKHFVLFPRCFQMASFS